MSRRRVGSCVVAGLLIVVAATVTWRNGWAEDGQGLADRFRQVDTDNDGRVTAAELPQADLFKRLDANGDGAVTLSEARQAVAAGVLKGVALRQSDRAAADRAGSTSHKPSVPPEIRQGPRVLKPGDRGVGRYVNDVAFQDLAGNRHQLSDFADHKAVVVAMTSTSCPLGKKYLPTLVDLAKSYASRNVAFVLVNPIATDLEREIEAARQSLGQAGVYVFDKDESLARAVGATSTTDVVVLDPSRTVVYHGAVDDQYGFGYAMDAPRQRYLAEALEALLSARQPTVRATEAPGCTLETADKPPLASDLTYHNRISRLVNQHCVECHRHGGVAPFSLESYDDVESHAPMIEQVVERGVMPPWFAAPTADHQPSPWLNDRSLASSERADLLAWIAAGTPEGDVQDAPQPRRFADGWLIGRPDAVFEFAEPVKVQATGTMPYQHVVVETHLPEDKWVQAIEVQPGDRRVVHHVLVFVTASDEGVSSDRHPNIDERTGYWGLYVPGNSMLVYPAGYARHMPKGAKLRFQMHYTPNGTATEDRTRIGIVFADSPPRQEVHVVGIVNSRLSIPPGAPQHAEVASLRLPFDVQVLAFLPHMHLRGTAARYEVVAANGGAQMLLDVPRYDFNWQLLYRLADPMPLTRGDTIQFTAWYDNSANNPANPDPTRTVRWGPQTDDEMHLGYVEYIVPGAKLGEPSDIHSRGRIAETLRAANGERLFQLLDANHDGTLSKEELHRLAENAPRLRDKPKLLDDAFNRLDADRSGTLDKTEFDRLRSLVDGRE